MASLLESRVIKIEGMTLNAGQVHLYLHDNYQIEIYRDNKSLTYFPSKTGIDFHSNDSMVRLIMGPIGSGKTSACCFEIVRRTALMPKMTNGKRYARWAVIRNTRGQLETTTVHTWLKWFTGFGICKIAKEPVLCYRYEFNDEHGAVEMEVLFLALDHEKDVAKIKSLEVTGAYINELSEMREITFSHIMGRCGREPDKNIVGDYWFGIISDTNPPDTEHWIYKRFEVDQPNNHVLFKQPPGLIKSELGYVTNHSADNISNLPGAYYENLAQGNTTEFIKVFCLGEYGIVQRGKPVYKEYNDDLHASDHLAYDPNLPISIGMDFGLTPAVAIVQFTSTGRLNIIDEVVADTDIGVREFVEARLIPHIGRYYPKAQIEFMDCDPAGMANQQGDRTNLISIVHQAGLMIAQPAMSNAIERRLDAVRYFLQRIVDGAPAFKLSKKKCPVLRKGFIGEYQYRLIFSLSNQRYEEKPFKNSFSHVHDGLQYIAMRYMTPMAQKSLADLSQFYNPVMSL